tara:strand:+ start:84 stop:872 length:789 start_codon:yes stop_codon:yes gene_type:complete
MGLFSKLTDAIKDAAPVIGGVVGFGLGGPVGAGIGSGIGGLVAGQDVDQAMKTALIGGTLGYGARAAGFAPASAGGFMPQFVGPKAATGFSITGAPTSAASVVNTAAVEDIGAQPSGIFGNLFTDMTTGQKLALGLGGLGAVAALTQDEEEEFERRPEPVGEMFDITSRSRDEDRTLFLTDPEDLAQYQRELAGTPFMPPISRMHGGEVHGPGTGTSDSVPARLSDGEFVLTAKAVRGAGGGDRDIGAARMYDMMSELEAQA